MTNLVTCPECKGTKVKTYTITVFGTPGATQHSMPCPNCNGVGECPQAQVDRYHRLQKAMKEFWCRCGNPSEQSTYHPDAPGSKHHWTCDDCGKTTQVG